MNNKRKILLPQNNRNSRLSNSKNVFIVIVLILPLIWSECLRFGLFVLEYNHLVQSILHIVIRIGSSNVGIGTDLFNVLYFRFNILIKIRNKNMNCFAFFIFG